MVEEPQPNDCELCKIVADEYRKNKDSAYWNKLKGVCDGA